MTNYNYYDTMITMIILYESTRPKNSKEKMTFKLLVQAFPYNNLGKPF